MQSPESYPAEGEENRLIDSKHEWNWTAHFSHAAASETQNRIYF